MNVIVVALITLFGVVCAPLILSRFNAKQLEASEAKRDRKNDAKRLEDYERQDEVAKQVRLAAIRAQEQAAAAAELLRQDNKRLSDRTEQVALVAAAAAATTDGKLDQIHTLVNSNMTEEMRRALVAVKGQQLLLRRVIDMAGNKVGEDDSSALKALDLQVAELEAALDDRLAQTKIADAEIGPPGGD